MKTVKVVCCLCLLLVSMLAISQPIPALAARPPLEEGEERINLDATYPAVELLPGESAELEFSIAYLTYQGKGEARTFDLVTTAPKNWTVYMTEVYAIKETRIASISLDPAMSVGAKLKVTIISPFWYMPEPGEYTITLEAIGTNQLGEELKNTIEFKATITDTYILSLVPATELYNTTVTAGKDNPFSIEIQNSGSAAIDDVTFSSSKPKGWTVKFSPDTIDSLSAVSSREIEINIKPPPKAIAGDYSITLRAEGKQTSAEKLDIRVTVETPTIWGWVGVGIILVVIAGVVFIFIRFSRR